MCHKRVSILGIGLVALLAMAPLFAFTILGNKVGIVDVFIESYVINGREAPSYTDAHGNNHVSGHDFYMVTVVKGTMGGEVKYRFHIEKVNLAYPEQDGGDSASHYNFGAAPEFKGSTAELVDSTAVPPDISARLPSTFTNPGKH
jgi:hypothetical protein